MSVAEAAHPQTPTQPRVVRDAAMDWVKFDAELARDGTVDPVDKALYAALASFVPASSGQQRTTDPDGHDAPTRRVLAACIGRSVDTIDRATKRLEERGLIAVERRQDPDNPRSNLPSVYRLLDHERWDERAAERAAQRKAQREEARRKAVEVRGAAQTRSDWPHGCGEGGRTDAATPGRTSAAVLLPSEKSVVKKRSLSEGPGESAVPAAAPAEEREISASQDKLSTAQQIVRAARVLADGEDESAFLDWVVAVHEPRSNAWWRTVAANGDLPGLVADWRAEAAPTGATATQRPAERRMPPWCRDPDCSEIDRMRDTETPDGHRVVVRCKTCHPDAAPTRATPARRPGGHVPFQCPPASAYDLDFNGRPLPGPDTNVAGWMAIANQLAADA